MGKIKVGTLCSGYDSQCMALDRLKENFPDFDYELVFWSEIDKYAIQAHNAVYPQWADRNLGDMTKIDWSNVGKVDLLTYSTPCTDISNAGQQKGIEKGSVTRSSILWYTEESIRILRPKYLLMENVKALASKKFLPYLKEWQNIVAAYGYSNYTAILNAKDYGVPQNRERVFMLSIRGDETYNFPKPFKLERRLKDVLEPNVDEKYYLSDKIIIGFENSTQIAREKGNGYRFKPTDSSWENNCFLIEIMEVIRTDTTICLNNKVDGKQPSLEHRIYDSNGVSVAVTCSFMPSITEPMRYRIRKLTPRECFRLMDMKETDIDKIQSAGISNSQQYKLAGNSIVVANLYHLFRKMFIEKENECDQLTIF